MRVKYNGNNTKDLNTISENNHTPRSFSERWGAFKKVVKKVAMFMLMIEGVNMAPVGGTFVEKNFVGLVYAQTTKEEQKVLKNFYDLYKKIAGLEPIKNTGFINVDAEHGKNLIPLVEKMGFTKKDDGIYYGDKLVYKFMEVKIEDAPLGTFKAIQIFDPKTNEKTFFDAIAAAYNAHQVHSAVEEANKKLAEAKEVPQPPLEPLVPTKTGGEKQEPAEAETSQIVAGKVVPQPLAQKGAEELDLKEVKGFVVVLNNLKNRLESDYGKIDNKYFLNNYNKLSQLLKKSKIDTQKVMEYVDGLAEFLLQDSPSLDVYNKLGDPNNKIKMLFDHLQMIGHILGEGIYHPIENPQDAQRTKINLEDLIKKYTKNCNLVLDGGKTKVPLLSVVGARLWFALVNDESLRRHLDEEAKPLFKEKFDKKDEKYKEIFNKIANIEELRFKCAKGLISQEKFVSKAFEIAKQDGGEAIKKLAENTENDSKKYDIIQKKLLTAAYTLLSMTELKLLIDLQKERKVAYSDTAVMLLDYAKEQYLWSFTGNITKPEYKPPAYFNDNVALGMANMGINTISTYFADFHAFIYRHYPQKKEEPPLKEMLFYLLENSVKYPFILKGLQSGSYNYLKRDVGASDDVVAGSFFTNVVSPNDKRFESFIGGADQSFWPSLIEYNNQKYNPYIGDYFVSEYVIKYHPDKFMTPYATDLICLNRLPEFNKFANSALSNLKNSSVFDSLVSERNKQPYYPFSEPPYLPGLLLYSPPKEIVKPDEGKKEPPPTIIKVEKLPPVEYRTPFPIPEITGPVGNNEFFVSGHLNASATDICGNKGINTDDLKKDMADILNAKERGDVARDFSSLEAFIMANPKDKEREQALMKYEEAKKAGPDALRQFVFDYMKQYGLGSDLNFMKYSIEKNKVRFVGTYGVEINIGTNLSEQELKNYIEESPDAFVNFVVNLMIPISYSLTPISVNIREYKATLEEQQLKEIPTGEEYHETLMHHKLELRPELTVGAFRAFDFLGGAGVVKLNTSLEIDKNQLDAKINTAWGPVSLSVDDWHAAIKNVGVSVEFPLGEGFKLRQIEFGKLDVANINFDSKQLNYDPGSAYGRLVFAYTIKPKKEGEKKFEVERVDIYASPTLIYRSKDIPYAMATLGTSALVKIGKVYVKGDINGTYEVRNQLWQVGLSGTVYFKNLPFGIGGKITFDKENLGALLNLESRW